MRNGLKLLFCSVIFSLSCSEGNKQINPLVGSWAIEKIQWISKDTTVNRIPGQKGILLITDKHYSICWSPLEQARTPFKNLSEPTQEEIMEGFGSIVFNTGSYTFSDDLFTTQAQMAKVPGFEGGLQYYSYLISGDQMTLTLYDETYPNGEKPDWYGTWRAKYSLTRLFEENTGPNSNMDLGLNQLYH